MAGRPGHRTADAVHLRAGMTRSAPAGRPDGQNGLLPSPSRTASPGSWSSRWRARAAQPSCWSRTERPAPLERQPATTGPCCSTTSARTAIFEMRTAVPGRRRGEPTPVVLAARRDNLWAAAIYSPDGRWIAYHTESASGWDIFVMPAAGGARKWQVTTDGDGLSQVEPRRHRAVGQHASTATCGSYEVDGSGDTFRVGQSRNRADGHARPTASGSLLRPASGRGADPAERGRSGLPGRGFATCTWSPTGSGGWCSS